MRPSAICRQVSGSLSLGFSPRNEIMSTRWPRVLVPQKIVLGLMVIVVACANYYLLTVRPKKKQAWKDMFQPDEEK